jgi:hypothetical protein
MLTVEVSTSEAAELVVFKLREVVAKLGVRTIIAVPATNEAAAAQ